MIQAKNMGYQDIVLRNPDTQATLVAADYDFAQFDGFIENIWAVLDAAGTTNSQVVEVEKNGTTIFTGSTLITFTTLVSPNAYDPVSAANRLVTKGDKFSIDVDSVHSGTAAKGLAVHIRLSPKARNASVLNQAPSALLT